ncbi:MAG: alpha/beta hydrolase [Microthrixaceae bacterium]
MAVMTCGGVASWGCFDDGVWNVSLGADVQALRSLGAEMSSGAAGLAESRRRIGAALERTWWCGPASQHFRRDWTAVHGPHLRDAESLLRDAGSALASQAAQQESASDGASPFSPRTGGGVRMGGGSSADQTDTRAGDRTSADLRIDSGTGTGGPTSSDEGSGGGGAKAGLSAPMFASSREEIQSTLQLLRKAEQAELVERNKWYHFGGLLWRGGELEAIRRTTRLYRGLAGPGRQILLLGPGRAAEVFGDLDSATRIGIWVPGVGTDLSAFASPGSLAANRIWDGDPDVAMIEWLGYDPPERIPQAAIELGYGARRAGDDLNKFVSQMKEMFGRDGEGPSIIIGGHSYGAVVAASAAEAGTRASGVVLAGSPGVPVGHVSGFSLDGGVVGSAENVAVVGNRFDPVAFGHLADEAVTAAVSLALAPSPWSLAFHLIGGAPWNRDAPTWWSQMSHDPSTANFGATRLPANDTRLSGAVTGSNHRYADPGSTSLQSLRSAFRR